MRSGYTWFALTLLTTLASACSDATAPVVVGAIEVAASVDLAWDSSAVLHAVARGSRGEALNVRLTWYSLDTAIATVDSAGRVHGRDLGVARIVVAADTVATVVQVRVTAKFVEFGLGDYISCGRTTVQEVFCWGLHDTRPARVPAARGLGHFAAGDERICGLDDLGHAWCWGAPYSGNGEVARPAGPVEVSGGLTFSDIGVGNHHACARRPDGSLYCWGENWYQVMTDEAPNTALTPVPVATTLRFTQVSVGPATTCGLTTDGSAWCWGNNNFDNTGFPGLQNGCYEGDPCVGIPVRVPTDSVLVFVEAGASHSCALTTGGTTLCWGWNGIGQLGDTLSTGCFNRPDRCSTRPQPVRTTTRFVRLTLGYDHTCGLTTDGAAWCWGANRFGQLGDGTRTDRVTPVPVSGGLRFRTLEAHADATCGMAVDDHAFCWGWDGWGQLNAGPGRQDRDVPTRMAYQP